jgi:hypothetical protein
VFSVRRSSKRVIAKTKQRRLIGIGDEPNIAASPAVTAVRSALGNVCFTSKTDAPRSSVTRLRVQLCRINE